MVEVYLHGGHIGGESHHNLFLLMTVFKMKRVFRDITTRPSVHPCLFLYLRSPIHMLHVCASPLYVPLFHCRIPVHRRRRLWTDCHEIKHELHEIKNFSIPKFSRLPGSNQYQIRGKFVKL
jgi:hypothetical protein